MHVVALSGGLSLPSRTLGLTRALTSHLEHVTGRTPLLVDLYEHATTFGAALTREDLPVRARQLLDLIAGADLLILASPVFKAAYPGLLKHVFDLLDRDALSGQAVILAANGASAHHALILESHLRPLASSLGAFTAPTAIYSQSSDFLDHELVNPAIHQRIEIAVTEALTLVQRLTRSTRDAA